MELFVNGFGPTTHVVAVHSMYETYTSPNVIYLQHCNFVGLLSVKGVPGLDVMYFCKLTMVHACTHDMLCEECVFIYCLPFLVCAFSKPPCMICFHMTVTIRLCCNFGTALACWRRSSPTNSRRTCYTLLLAACLVCCTFMVSSIFTTMKLKEFAAVPTAIMRAWKEIISTSNTTWLVSDARGTGRGHIYHRCIAGFSTACAWRVCPSVSLNNTMIYRSSKHKLNTLKKHQSSKHTKWKPEWKTCHSSVVCLDHLARWWLRRVHFADLPDV